METVETTPSKVVLLRSIIAATLQAEAKLAEQTLEAVMVARRGKGGPKKRPVNFIGDKGYDSDSLQKRLKRLKIDLIAPNRNNRKKTEIQDCGKLRRCRKKWKVERTFTGIGNFRCLVVRYKRGIKMYRSFFHFACLIIILNRF
jgi:transposase